MCKLRANISVSSLGAGVAHYGEPLLANLGKFLVEKTKVEVALFV